MPWKLCNSHLFLKCLTGFLQDRSHKLCPFFESFQASCRCSWSLNNFKSKVLRRVSGTSVWDSQSCSEDPSSSKASTEGSALNKLSREETAPNPSSADLNNCRCLPWKREGYRLLTRSLPVFCRRRTSGICCKTRTNRGIWLKDMP